MGSDGLGEVATVAGVAVASALDPTGGVLAATAEHVLTNLTVDSAWRSHVLDLWIEIIRDEQGERRRQYRETQSEFHRHRLILEWIKEELADVIGRVETLEAVALDLLAQTGGLLRARPDPEMRRYLVAAFGNALRHRERFSPMWVRRLTELLAKVSADHLAMLTLAAEKAEPAHPQGHGHRAIRDSLSIAGPEKLLVFNDMVDLGLLQRDGGVILLMFIGDRLAEFVTARKSTS